MIHLELVNERTFKKIVDMKLPDAQHRFVAPNVVSLAQAWLYYSETRPYAVLNDGEPVGFLMLDWDEGERTVGFWRLMIAFDQQHKGYGRAALKAAIEMVRGENKFDMIHLDYVPGNEIARDLYASLGFRENGEVDDGEIIMTLPLTDKPKIGMTTADEEELDEMIELVETEKRAGGPVPEALSDREKVTQAVARREIKRLTLMGKTVGLAYGDELLLQKEHRARLDEAKARVGKG